MSDLRCPRCGAACRPGDQWCGLCYADFRVPPPVAVDAAAPPPAPEAAAQAPAQPAELAPPLIRPPVPGAPATPRIPSQPAPPAPQASGSPFVPSTNPLAPGARPTSPTPAGAAAAVAAQDGAHPQTTPETEAAEVTWPCPRCEQLVPIEEDYCEACGHGFLDDVRATGGTRLPLVGDVTKLNSGQRLMFGLLIAVGIIVGLLILFTLGGAIFH